MCSFYFFFFSDCLAKPSKTVLNKSSGSGHPCFVPNLRGNAFSFSPLNILDVGLFYMAFIMLRCSPSLCPLSGEFFFFLYHEWVLNFIKSFPYIYWDDHMAFILQFVNMMYQTGWSVDIEKFLPVWDKSHLIMVYNLFNGLLELIC